jgi:hypothetical protein
MVSPGKERLKIAPTSNGHSKSVCYRTLERSKLTIW